jgi:hypothetical protein
MQHKWSKFKYNGETSFGNQHFGKKFGTLSIFLYKKGVDRKIGKEDILVMLNHKLRRKKI